MNQQYDVFRMHLPSGRRFELYLPAQLTQKDCDWFRQLMDVVLIAPEQPAEQLDEDAKDAMP